MAERTPTAASQGRHLLPRHPSDRVVMLAFAAGLGAAAALRLDPFIGLAPGAILATWQKVNGHLQAWKGGGVERAFVMESSAISFYVVVGLLVVVGGLQAGGVVPHFNDVWWFEVAVFVDTTVRSSREKRYI